MTNIEIGSAALRRPGDGADHDASDVMRRYPVGAEALPGDRAHIRVWAPKVTGIRVEIAPDARIVPLRPDGDGHFSALIENMPDGSLYGLRLDGDDRLYPDPASRFQPEGPHGHSQLIDPFRFAWTDDAWLGHAIDEAVIYEMHIGTFTPEGTWEAALEELPHLAALGITVLEVMPVAAFPGRFGWGYDGVDLFAPTHLYGTPDAMRRFVDRAHGLGLAVILDVVYNHFGPDGNYLSCFADAYTTDRYDNEWGDAINFDGPDSGPVRAFFLANAAYWIDEFHLDGLRLDATQQVFDRSSPHILAEIRRAVARAAHGRTTIVVGENEPQDTGLVQTLEAGGCGLDALWNDDFHHSAMVALTGRGEAYYSDHCGKPQEFVSAMKHGFLYQGQWYQWQRQPRGTPTRGTPPAAFVTFLQNHDQIANSAGGQRGHALAAPGCWRAMTAVMLLGPGTPMLFQGQEFAASAPFLYFADHKPELASQVAQGRAAFLRQFPSLDSEAMQRHLATPEAEATFARCKLDHQERERNRPVWEMHRDLLRLRREDPVLRNRHAGALDGAVLGEEAFVLRFFGTDGDDRLLLVNLGHDLTLVPMPEPLLAPPAGRRWDRVWSSEDAAYGGTGTPPLTSDRAWTLPGHAAVLLRPGAPYDPISAKEKN